MSAQPLPQTSNQGYTVKLPYFEGPFDLLLYFIERDELDIYDIPISRITDDFLGYIRQMERLNIDLASEFILVAASLMRVKAKMLLPRKQVDEEGNEIDPREELIQRLLEYKQYKSILDDMRKMEADRGEKRRRGNVARELKEIATKALVDAELESLTLFKLLRTFQTVTARFEDRIKRENPKVIRFNYSISQQQRSIFQALRARKKVDFKDLFLACENKVHAIFQFLAMLELLHLQKLSITQGNGMNNFWVSEVG